MLKLMKFMGLAIGLMLVAITFGGVKRIDPCNATAALGGRPMCDNNIQWFNQ
jgi:hypothetical protein